MLIFPRALKKLQNWVSFSNFFVVFFFHLKVFFFLLLWQINRKIYKLQQYDKANIYAAFSRNNKLRQITYKGLISYCENAPYYNTAQSLSLKKEKKTIHIYTKNKLEQTEAKTKFTHPHTPCSLV